MPSNRIAPWSKKVRLKKRANELNVLLSDQSCLLFIGPRLVDTPGQDIWFGALRQQRGLPWYRQEP